MCYDEGPEPFPWGAVLFLVLVVAVLVGSLVLA